MFNYRHAHHGPLAFVEPHAVTPADEPHALRELFAANRRFSANFLADAGRRQRWFDQHVFRVFCRICSDGRCLCLEQALGEDRERFEGIPAAVIETDRSIGAISGLDSSPGCMIFEKRLRNLHSWGMKALSLEFAHESSLNPHSSCSALDNDTRAAIEIVRHNAAEMNFAYDGAGLAIAALLDTDTYAITLFGPDGQILKAIETARDPSFGRRAQMMSHFRGLLRKTFPEGWHPLARLGKTAHDAFYRELSKLLMYNALWVRHVARTGWRIKMDGHEERILAVGRQIEPLKEPNSVFLVADHSSHKTANFEVGLGFVVINSIKDAIADGEKCWRAPVLVSLPYDGSPRLQQLNVRNLKERLMTIAARSRERIAEKARKALPDMPSWAEEQLKDAHRFVESILWTTSVSNRADRLLVPFE